MHKWLMWLTRPVAIDPFLHGLWKCEQRKTVRNTKIGNGMESITQMNVHCTGVFWRENTRHLIFTSALKQWSDTILLPAAEMAALASNLSPSLLFFVIAFLNHAYQRPSLLPLHHCDGASHLITPRAAAVVTLPQMGGGVSGAAN